MPGYETDRFVGLSQDEKAELTCSICQDIFKCPIVTNCCLQTFCEDCINDWLKTNNSCPYDRKELNKSTLTRPPRVLVNILGKLKIRCDYYERGCNEVLLLENINQHSHSCHFNLENSRISEKNLGNDKLGRDGVKSLLEFNQKTNDEINALKKKSESTKAKSNNRNISARINALKMNYEAVGIDNQIISAQMEDLNLDKNKFSRTINKLPYDQNSEATASRTSEMKEKSHSSDYGKVSPKSTTQQLVSKLGTRQSDLSRFGIVKAAKDHCQTCHEPIVGPKTIALGMTWHPEHFTCVHCGCGLRNKQFFDRNSEPYCETDYHNLFSPKCAHCHESIRERYTTALDMTWHVQHFMCAHCKKPFGDDNYYEKDGRPYCREDYGELFAPKCHKCNTAISGKYITALNTKWHTKCFVCTDCRSPFDGGKFFEHKGQPYCEVHHH